MVTGCMEWVYGMGNGDGVYGMGAQAESSAGFPATMGPQKGLHNHGTPKGLHKHGTLKGLHNHGTLKGLQNHGTLSMGNTTGSHGCRFLSMLQLRDPERAASMEP